MTSSGKISALSIIGLLALSACTVNREINSLEVHDVLFYGARSERVTWFYGALTDGRLEGAVKLGTQTLKLREQLRNDPLALLGTLSVLSGTQLRSALRGPATILPQQFSVSSVVLSNELAVQTRVKLDAVYYTDGRGWYKLSGPLAADRGGKVSPSAVSGLRGVGELTDAEADVLSNQLKLDGPQAIGVLNKADLPDAAQYVEPSPLKYLQTGLIIQKGVPANLNVFTPPLNPSNTGRYSVFGSGGNARYSGEGPIAYLSKSFSSFDSVWRTAYGNQSPVPSAPNVDFAGNNVATIFLGQKATGGYGLSVSSTAVDGNTLTVNVSTTSPKPGLIQTQALTSPWVSLRVEGNYTRLIVRDSSGNTLAESSSN